MPRYKVRLPKLTIRTPGDSLEASISVATNQNFPPFTRRPAFQSVQPLWASAAYSFANDNDRLVAVYSHGCWAKYLRMRQNTTESDKTIKLRELNWTARSSARDTLSSLRTCANCESCVSNNISGASSLHSYFFAIYNACN